MATSSRLNKRLFTVRAQSLATNSPAPGAPPPDLRRLQRVLRHQKLWNYVTWPAWENWNVFSSTGACTATKSPIVNHRSSIIAQLYVASVTQMFLMPLSVKVESDSSKLLRTVSKSGPNGCKGRSRPQKILMRIQIESFFRTTKSSLDGYTLPQTITGRAKSDSNINCSHNYNDKFLKSSDMIIKGSGVVPPGEISECTEKKSMTRNAHLSRGAD